MIRSDYHLHTEFSGDSKTKVTVMIDKGIALGMETLCFTDHMDIDYPHDGIDFILDIAAYRVFMQEMKERYCGTIEILTGIELGLQPHLNADYKAVMAAGFFDFAIGSTHVIDKWDPYFKELRPELTADSVIRQYLLEIIKNINSFSDFQVVGHLDYVVRYVDGGWKDYNWKEYEELFVELLRLIIDKGLGIEVNSSGYKYNGGCCHPFPDIIKKYREMGGEIITIGSDAHVPEYMALGFDQIKDILVDSGFRYFTQFRNQQPSFVKLV